jgi:hypothetical protein
MPKVTCENLMFIILPSVKTYGVSFFRYTMPKLHNVKPTSIVRQFKKKHLSDKHNFVTNYIAVNRKMRYSCYLYL